MMRLGYAYWGFLADEKVENGIRVSTPDGNAAYSWSILWEAQKRGWETWLLQRDRDAEFVNGRCRDAFSSFSPQKRWDAYRRANKTITTSDITLCELDGLPDLDVVLIEWRWPIVGRNIGIDPTQVGYQPDLDRQLQLLDYFKSRDTKIILWDLDHKLTASSEELWKPDAIFETSVMPVHNLIKRTRVEPPIVIEDLHQFLTLPCEPSRKLVYIGSRYERDDVISKWIKPVSDRFPFEVEFYGNWTKEPNLTECRMMWPNILYNDRVTITDFRRIYGSAVACPILAKPSYLATGFITPRPWEALMFGTLPVGISDHLGVEDYTMMTAPDADTMGDMVEDLSRLDRVQRAKLKHDNIEKIHFMDVSYFVDTIEGVVG